MEPVPETERLEEFRASPIPKLRLSTDDDSSESEDASARLYSFRRATDPTSSPHSPVWSPANNLPFRPRTTSPYARGHIRARSTASGMPTLPRAQSLPGVNAAGHLLPTSQWRSSSPHHTQPRVRTPKKPVDEVFPGRGRVETRDGKTAVVVQENDLGSSPGVTSPMLRTHRPMSPLRNYQSLTTPSTPTSAASSPYSGPVRYQDSFLSASISSMPSTPTSARSRSPSISSLETIPDTPDAEEAALEAERLLQLKTAAAAAAAAAAADADDPDATTLPVRGRTLSAGFGRDKRKRWSVCGAERRGDLDLETIWED